tara:strand:+ start:13533 stop:14000 length:468 start_codon:yes stop_codon:yes gene_type:complete
MVQAKEIVEEILSEYEGVIAKSSWGETALFYNPGKMLPNGVYFCTIKEKNGENDKSSELDREGVFRLSIGVSKNSYEKMFGLRPNRPAKGDKVDLKYSFVALNKLMPHPIYAWMSWLQVLNPDKATLSSIQPLLNEAYTNAVIKFNKKPANKPKH